MDIERQKKLIKAGKFKENNGAVMRVFNMCEHDFHPLTSLAYALPNLTRGELIESINYLYEAGYLHLRSIDDDTDVSISDKKFEELKAKATANGSRLLRYAITDPCVEL